MNDVRLYGAIVRRSLPEPTPQSTYSGGFPNTDVNTPPTLVARHHVRFVVQISFPSTAVMLTCVYLSIERDTTIHR
jgi:hypothetical protein